MVEYTFFSSVQRPFYRIDHVPGHKTSVNHFKEIETIPHTFLDPNLMKLGINSTRITGKFTNIEK
jgi:hypothetical protein